MLLDCLSTAENPVGSPDLGEDSLGRGDSDYKLTTEGNLPELVRVFCSQRRVDWLVIRRLVQECRPLAPAVRLRQIEQGLPPGNIVSRVLMSVDVPPVFDACQPLYIGDSCPYEYLVLVGL
ncbi:hypothetical protein SKAU_G00189700 [Synaphobranchus kaupii]|uniref:Uncharacterized protein n=1 Tax=Synaphobranchus kaupii TaxID=118154 RepID=A0A9Q1FDB2_SYNKA|nr:hypothetical protein SKAU_G00189700 [Synaphobranchus kaupii]